MTELIKIDYFFADYRKFPWDILGLTVPRIGPLHSYLAEILSELAPEPYREFMRTRPSFRELSRAGRAVEHSIMGQIASYCENFYKMRDSDRRDVAQEVLNFLVTCKPFKDHVQKTLDRLYLQDRISVPLEARPREY